MHSIFVRVSFLESSVIASIAIILMIPIRRLFRKQLGNQVISFAWALVAIRLLCPLFLPNLLIRPIRSLLGANPVKYMFAGQSRASVSAAVEGFHDLFRKPNDQAAGKAAAGDIQFANASSTLLWIWLIGVLLILGWVIFCNVRFRVRMRRDRIEPISGELLDQYKTLCRQRGVRPVPVYITDPLPNACVVGIFQPCIVLPLSTPPEDAVHILAHEICHIRSRDYLWEILRLLCCTIYWLNPMVWMAASMSRTDSEICCDERVVKTMNREEKESYAKVLVHAVARRKTSEACVLTTGMTMTGKNLKTRIAAIMRNKTNSRWLAIVFAVLASLCLIVSFAGTETEEPSSTVLSVYKPGATYVADQPVMMDGEAVMAVTVYPCVLNKDLSMDLEQTLRLRESMQRDEAGGIQVETIKVPSNVLRQILIWEGASND